MQNQFDKNEFKNSEHVYKDAKQISVDLRPYKKLSDYVKVEVKIEIFGRDLKQVEITKKGLTKKMFKGHLEVKFTAYLTGAVIFFVCLDFGKKLLFSDSLLGRLVGGIHGPWDILIVLGYLTSSQRGFCL